MGIISNLIERRSYSELDDYWYMPFGKPTKAGIDVNESSAMKYSVVWACVRAISETMATLPLNVYRRLKDKGKEKATEHPLHRLLHTQPNPEMTAVQYREASQSHVLLWGNHYSEIRRNRQNRIIELWPLDPSRMTPGRDSNNELVYNYRPSQDTPRIYAKEEILHVPGLGFNGLMGYSVISMAQEAVAMGLGYEEFAARFFSNDAHGSGYLQLPQGMSLKDDEARERLKKSWGSGLEQAHKVKILEAGAEWKTMSIPLRDAQFVEGRNLQALEICRFYNVPPYKIFDYSRATWGNVENMAIDWVVHGIRPWLVRWEQAILTKLFSIQEQDEYFAEHVVDGLLRGDVAARGEFYTKMFNIGVYSQNDILEFENKNPIQDGDKHYVPLNMKEIGEESIIPETSTPGLKPQEEIMEEGEEEEEEEKKKKATQIVISERITDLERQISQKEAEIANFSGILTQERAKDQAKIEELNQIVGQKNELTAKLSQLKEETETRLNQEIIERDKKIIQLEKEIRDTSKASSAFSKLFVDGVRRVMRREEIAIKKALKKKDLESFEQHLTGFYAELPEFMGQTFHPIAASYGELIGVEDGASRVARCVPEYIADSRQEISNWVGVYVTGSSSELRVNESAIDDCMKSWMNGRSERWASQFQSFFASS